MKIQTKHLKFFTISLLVLPILLLIFFLVGIIGFKNDFKPLIYSYIFFDILFLINIIIYMVFKFLNKDVNKKDPLVYFAGFVILFNFSTSIGGITCFLNNYDTFVNTNMISGSLTVIFWFWLIAIISSLVYAFLTFIVEFKIVPPLYIQIENFIEETKKRKEERLAEEAAEKAEKEKKKSTKKEFNEKSFDYLPATEKTNEDFKQESN